MVARSLEDESLDIAATVLREKQFTIAFDPVDYDGSSLVCAHIYRWGADECAVGVAGSSLKVVLETLLTLLNRPIPAAAHC